MKINIDIDGDCRETEVTIVCSGMSAELEKVIASLRVLDYKITGVSGGQTYILDVDQILYIDTVDKKTFIYTKKDVYESPLRLYELEHQLSSRDFFRASKSSIINFSKIKSLKSDIGGKIIVFMENNEKLIVSRQYTSFIKEKLGRQ